MDGWPIPALVPARYPWEDASADGRDQIALLVRSA